MCQILRLGPPGLLCPLQSVVRHLPDQCTMVEAKFPSSMVWSACGAFPAPASEPRNLTATRGNLLKLP